MLKFENNPPPCPATVQAVAELPGDWWVAHTKPRCEKALAFDLAALNIGFYLPLVRRVKMSGGRKRKLMMPLFPSYVFFCGTADDRYTAVTTNRIVQVLPVKERGRFVTEISAVETALRREAALDLYPFAAVGRRCRVRAGPFMGVEGTVIKRDDRTLIVMHIGILGRGASLEIDADLLEQAD